MTFRDACLQFGITEDKLYNDDSDAEDNLYSNNSNRADEEGMQISEEEEETAPFDDNEGNVEIFKENATDEGDEEDEETVNANDCDTDHEDEECVLSRKEIEYSTPPISARRRMRNTLTQSFKVIANPRDIESFELFLSEDILRTVLMHTNRKAREISRTLSTPQPFKIFSMDELKAGLAIILRAESDRDNFTKLDNLWQPEDSKPFYRAVMFLVRFKFLLRCLQFDNWNTREERKVHNKFPAVVEIWDIFLISLRRACIPDYCITVDELLVRYRGRIPDGTYILSKPRKYGLKMFWACESSSGYVLNGLPYGDKEGDQVHRNLTHDIVTRLLEPYFGKDRDVCTDNIFTSYNLAKLLLQENLTLLGTTRKHRREVPGSLNRKIEIYFSKFLFNHVNGICLFAYQAKKNKNPVMLLSSSHADNWKLLMKQKKQ